MRLAWDLPPVSRHDLASKRRVLTLNITVISGPARWKRPAARSRKFHKFRTFGPHDREDRMPNRSPSKQRLEELIALARTYRGWSSKDLARELGRDVHHLVPNSGVPKLDIVMALADALDWTVQDVVDDLCGNVPAGASPSTLSKTASDGHERPPFAALNRAAWDALQNGAFERAAAIAREAYRTASTGEERATACMRECGAWDGLGRFQLAIECAQRGLREDGCGHALTLNLRSNLANGHYLLGNYEESVGIASALIMSIGACDLVDGPEYRAAGFARYVRGSAIRSRLASGMHVGRGEVEIAVDDLAVAAGMMGAMGDRLDAPSFKAIAHTCRGAELTVSCLTGHTPPGTALEEVSAVLDAVVEPAEVEDKHFLESIGWWCIFGCEIAIRRLDGDEAQHRHLAVLTNKADEISRTTGNWAIRERVWNFELLRRLATSSSESWVIDAEDARELTGTMARFPHFRSIGWRIFRSAELGGGG